MKRIAFLSLLLLAAAAPAYADKWTISYPDVDISPGTSGCNVLVDVTMDDTAGSFKLYRSKSSSVSRTSSNLVGTYSTDDATASSVMFDASTGDAYWTYTFSIDDGKRYGTYYYDVEVYDTYGHHKDGYSGSAGLTIRWTCAYETAPSDAPM